MIMSDLRLMLMLILDSHTVGYRRLWMVHTSQADHITRLDGSSDHRLPVHSGAAI